MKKMFFPFVILALLSLLISCSEISDSGKTEKNGKARVSFSVQEAGRTIMPTNMTEDDVVKVELSAEILSDEGEYADYSFTDSTGKKTTLSWTDSTALAEFKSSTIELDFGTYNFHLSLYASDEANASPVQTGSIEEIEIDSTTETIAFTNLEYKDNGDVPINVSWKFTDEGRNPIAKVTCSFCTIESKGTEFVLGSDGIYLNNILLSVTEDSENKTASASADFKSVPNGSYYIKLFLYTDTSDETPINTITEIIKVKGYKTSWNLDFEDLSELNVLYYVCYHPVDGKWKNVPDGEEPHSEDSYAYRNAYESVIIPTIEDFIPPDGMNTLTWYTTDPESESFSEDSLITEIKAKTAENNTAHDYDLYAKWTYVAEASGNISTDNRALLISIDNTELYQNSTVNFSVTDADGNVLSSDETVTYTAQILYKGTDINDLAESSDNPYYTRSGAKLTLKGATNSIPAGTYQLYVTATRSGTPEVTSSQTFEITIGDSFATPETQVALYSYSSGSYNFYLKDFSDVKSELNTVSLSSNIYVSAFDAAGYFYTATYNGSTEPYATIKSNNPVIGSDELPLSMSENGSDRTYYFNDFVVDLVTNTAYASAVNGQSLYLFKYPSLISKKDMTDVVLYDSSVMNVENFTASKIAVNNNILYVYGNVYNVGDKLYVYDISSDTTPVSLSNFDVTTYMTGTMGLSSSATVNDIFAMEGAVYILVSDSSNGTSSNKNIYRRGSVIKYVPPATANGTGTKTYLAINTTPSLEHSAISNMTLYYAESLGSSRISDLYTDETVHNAVVTINGLQSKDSDENTAQELLFPDVYAPTEAEKALSSPMKFIAVKPKKLVIADDGIAFYTESDGCLSYRNMNRVVTIDLQDFVVASVNTTSAKFDKELSSYIRSTISLEPLASGGNVVASQEQGYFYVGSGDYWVTINKTTTDDNTYTSKTYLSVKPGE